ncbi:MAG: Crp/Fnr family transcriptional regulator [Bacteroidia bacterium]
MMKPESLQQLKSFLLSFNLLEENDVDELLISATFRKLDKADYFIREGEICREVAFVVSGIFRSFYSAANNDEITYCILFPNVLITAYSSYITGNPSAESIQAISPAELIVLPREKIAALSAENIGWIRFEKMIAEQQYIELERRVFQFQKEKAAERYRDLINNHPDYIKHIPLQYLASYLGITQRHLSRIRKEISF